MDPDPTGCVNPGRDGRIDMKTSNQESGGVNRPRRCNAPQLAKVGVEIIDEHQLHLSCTRCGQVWSPMQCAGGSLPRGYWKCPRGCNG